MMKLFWGFILLGFIFFEVHASDYAIIEDGNHKGLANERGKVIIPPIYDDLGWSEGGSSVVEDVIGYKMGELWGLISTRNIKITSPDFIRLIPYDQHSLIASKPDSYKLNEIYGLVTLSGKTIIDFKYSHLRTGLEGLIASIRNKGKFYFGIIDSRGNNLVAFNYKNIEVISRDIYALEDFNGKIHLINTVGKTLLHFPIDKIEPFTEDLLIYEQEGKKGLLKNSGELITVANYQEFKLNDSQSLYVLPQIQWQIFDFQNGQKQAYYYDSIEPLDKSLYKTKRSNYSFIVRQNGDILFKVKDSEIDVLNDSLASVTLDGKKGVINYSGDLIIPADYDSIRINGSNLFLYQKKGISKSWNIADLSGTLLSAERYDRIHPIDQDYRAVMKNGFWGVVHKEGKEMIPPIYDTIYDVTNHLFLVGFHGEKGVVDSLGEWRSFPRRGDLFILDNSRYLISSYYGSSVISLDGSECHYSENYLRPIFNSFIEEDYKHKMGILNGNFQKILPVDYDTILAIVEDSIFIFRNESGWGEVDRHGNILFKNDQRCQDILGCNEDYIGVQIDGQYGFVDLYGRLRIANRYQGIRLYNEGLAHINILGKWGCIDKKESIVIQPYYDDIFPFENGLAIARKDGKAGIIDCQGNVKINFEYDDIKRIRNGGFICTLNNQSGLIDANGILKFYPKFDFLQDLQNNYVLVKRKEKYGLMTSDGIIKIPIIHDHMKYDPVNQVILAADDPHWKIIGLTTK